jgi:hypothetical protein
MSVKMKPKELVQRAPFSDLFPVDEDVRKELVESMKVDGYDPTKPVYAWRTRDEEVVLVEGHMRVAAAIQARIKEIPVEIRWKGEEQEASAFVFAIASQRVRRNLTKERMAEMIADAELRRRGEHPEPESTEPRRPGRQADPVKAAVVKQAKEVGVSKRTAETGLAKARAKQEAKPKSAAEQARALRLAQTGKQLEPLRSALLIGQANGRRFYWPKSLYPSMEDATQAARDAGVIGQAAGLSFTQYRARGEFGSLVAAIEAAGQRAPVLPSQQGPGQADVDVAVQAAVNSAKLAAELAAKAAKAGTEAQPQAERQAQAQADDAARLWANVSKILDKRQEARAA